MKHTFDDFKKFRELLKKLPYSPPRSNTVLPHEETFSIVNTDYSHLVKSLYSDYIRNQSVRDSIVTNRNARKKARLTEREIAWLDFFIKHTDNVFAESNAEHEKIISKIYSDLRLTEPYPSSLFNAYLPFITRADYLEYGMDNLTSPNFKYFYILILAWLYDKTSPKNVLTQRATTEEIIKEQREIVNAFIAMAPDGKKELALSKIFNVFAQINQINSLANNLSLSYNDVLQKPNPPHSGYFFIGWNKVQFSNGFYFIYHPNFSNCENGIYPLRIDDIKSRSAFNDIKSYFLLRLPPIFVQAKFGRIIRVLNQQELSKCISLLEQKIASSTKSKENRPIVIPNKKQKKEISKEIAKNIIKGLKSRFLNYLCGRQLDDFNVVCCIENRINANNISAEYAFIFTIKEHGPYLTLAFENSHDSRCTYLFTVPKRDWNKAINEIYDFFASDAVNKRASLAKRIADLRLPGNFDYRRVMHSDYLKWADNIKFGNPFK